MNKQINVINIPVVKKITKEDYDNLGIVRLLDGLFFVEHNMIGEELELQQLYFTSNDKLKENDFFVWKDEIHQYDYDRGYGIQTKTEKSISAGDKLIAGNVIVNHSNNQGKIIATTNKDIIISVRDSLFGSGKDYNCPFPKPSKEFLEIFCEFEHISKVLVEYEYSYSIPKAIFDTFDNKEDFIKLKVNFDNTITIKPF